MLYDRVVGVARWGPRVIDLDIVLYGNEPFDSDTLTIPHARLAERDFVLAPLCDINSGTSPHPPPPRSSPRAHAMRRAALAYIQWCAGSAPRGRALNGQHAPCNVGLAHHAALIRACAVQTSCTRG